jgi:hypothetical protein
MGDDEGLPSFTRQVTWISPLPLLAAWSEQIRLLGQPVKTGFRGH